MHNGNVFILSKPVPVTWKTPSGLSIELPSTTKKATIADFGLSAATDPRTSLRHARVDYELMNVEEKSWGKWSHELEGNEGYDFTVLFFCLLRDSCNLLHKKWLKGVEKKIRALQPKLKVSSRSRPLQDVGLHPEKILQECFTEFLQI
jgi:hypothetical protein